MMFIHGYSHCIYKVGPLYEKVASKSKNCVLCLDGSLVKNISEKKFS